MEDKITLLQTIWNSRNPCREINTNTGEDMFWPTVLMVFNDYQKTIQHPHPSDSDIEKMWPGEVWDEGKNELVRVLELNRARQEGAKWMRDRMNGEIVEKHIDCPYCDGQGWTAEHAPHNPDEDCVECPIQMPCGYCYASGRVTTKLMKEHIESRTTVNNDDLPF